MNHPHRTAAEPITPREREALALLAQGLPQAEVARRMGITADMVRLHRRKAERMRALANAIGWAGWVWRHAPPDTRTNTVRRLARVLVQKNVRHPAELERILEQEGEDHFLRLPSFGRRTMDLLRACLAAAKAGPEAGR